MATNYVPILGRVKRATTISKTLDVVLTRLWIVMERQFQLIKSTEIPSLKRAFEEVNQRDFTEIKELVENEVTKALSYNFKNYTVEVNVNQIAGTADYVVGLAITVYDDNNKPYYASEELIYTGSIFKKMIGDQAIYG